MAFLFRAIPTLFSAVWRSPIGGIAKGIFSDVMAKGTDLLKDAAYQAIGAVGTKILEAVAPQVQSAIQRVEEYVPGFGGGISGLLPPPRRYQNEDDENEDIRNAKRPRKQRRRN